ncbi:hypothetical protein ACFW04_014771 [Cataglyphis niger]
MVRSHPYLYDKNVENYKDTKEKQLREQETRSGAGKPTTQKWILYESCFFGKIYNSKKVCFIYFFNLIIDLNFSNINYAKPSEPSNASETSLKTQHSIIIQDDYEMSTNDNFNTSTSTFGQQSLHTLISKEDIYNTLPNMSIHKNQPIVYLEQNHDVTSLLLRRMPLATEETSLIASETEGSSVKVSPPTSCFSENQQRIFKKRRIDPVETAFHQINNTLNTIVAEVCSRRKPVMKTRTIHIIGKLVTTELQMTAEP